MHVDVCCVHADAGFGSAGPAKQQQQQQQQEEEEKGGATARISISSAKASPCLTRRLTWILLALLLLMAVLGTTAGVVVSRSRAHAQQIAAGAAAAAAQAGASQGVLLYSINIKMAQDSSGNRGPSCDTLFRGANPRTVSDVLCECRCEIAIARQGGVLGE